MSKPTTPTKNRPDRPQQPPRLLPPIPPPSRPAPPPHPTFLLPATDPTPATFALTPTPLLTYLTHVWTPLHFTTPQPYLTPPHLATLADAFATLPYPYYASIFADTTVFEGADLAHLATVVSTELHRGVQAMGADTGWTEEEYRESARRGGWRRWDWFLDRPEFVRKEEECGVEEIDGMEVWAVSRGVGIVQGESAHVVVRERVRLVERREEVRRRVEGRTGMLRMYAEAMGLVHSVWEEGEERKWAERRLVVLAGLLGEALGTAREAEVPVEGAGGS